MTPIDQEFIHDPDNGVYGDCQRAVVASLLDMPISEVPHFLAVANGDTAEYYDLLSAFCRKHGYAYLTTPAMPRPMCFGDDGDVFHEINGLSPRGGGVYHAVVGRNGQVFHDPHPSRAGLSGTPDDWRHCYLVRAAHGIQGAKE